MSGPTKSIVALALLLIFMGTSPGRAEIRSIHQDLSVNLVPGDRSLAVSAKLKIAGGGPLVFRLARNFVVTSFMVDGEKTAVKRFGDKWLIDLGGEARHDVALDYRGGLAPVPTNSGPFGTNDPISAIDGSFLPAGSGWHPSFGGTAFSYRLDITVPEPQRAVAPGRLISEHSSGGKYRVVFESIQPLHGIVLMAGPYRINERLHGKIRLRTYFHPDIADLSEGYLDATADYLDLYENWIGGYPYSAFHIVSGLLPVGLGYPGLTFMGKRVLALPFIRSTSLGHEVLHNWWGNGVDIDLAQGNWSEGLTTFMADYTFARRRSEKDALAMRIAWLRDYAALPAARDHPVTSFVSRSHDAEQIIGYNKVAFIFHMARRNIGKAAFDSGIRLFWQRHAFAAAGWADLQKAFEETSGRDLGTFFRQWLEQSGAPTLVLEHASANGNTVSFRLRQPSSDYRLNVPVDVTTEMGNERFDVAMSGGTNTFELTANSPVRGLTIDPDFDIFRHLGANETPPILRDVTLDTETRTLILADGNEWVDLARRLAGRLQDSGSDPVIVGNGAGSLPNTPLLLIGETRNIATFLKLHGLPATPEDIRRHGSARVWVTRTGGETGPDRPLMVIEADTPAALGALFRPLPHYRRQGFVVFDGAKVIAKGTRPARHGPLSVQFK